MATGVVLAVGSLWLTEPDLPPRTRIAFAALCAIGSAWVIFCFWVLTRRKVLYARERIVSARIAVAASTAFVVGSLTLGLTQQTRGGLLAAACGAVVLALALVLLRRAQQQHAALQDLRRRLSNEENTAELAA